MIFKSPKNPNSHLTVKERTKPSLPTKVLLERNLIVGRVLDFGCGLGTDLEFLKNKNIDVTGFDPYYKPEVPTGKFDTIICNYVLNVLLPEEQSHVLMAISELLKKGGKAYFAVRRDIERNGMRYNPYRQCDVYQCNVVLNYKSIFTTKNCEIYEYQHFNSIKNTNTSCVFCKLDPDAEVITESATFYAIYDKYPVSKGHTLVIPKRHIDSFFDLSAKEQYGCVLVVNRVKEILEKQFLPDGFNVGINIGEAAGQTIFHAHAHVIPRFKNDTENPRGGVRGVIHGKADY